YVKITRPSRERRYTAAPGGAFLGISPDTNSEADGLRLGSVLAGTAAARAGLLRGDVIVPLADRPVNGFAHLRRIIDAKRPGDAVAVVYLRDGEEHQAAAVLDTRP